MDKQIILFVAFWLATIQISISQNIKGMVMDDADHSHITGALIRIDGEQTGAFTDENGLFLLDAQGRNFPVQLITSFVGYHSDTLIVNSADKSLMIHLKKKDGNIDAVVVQGAQKATDIDPMAGQQIELVSGKELLKAACCNLSESFENSATVDVSYSDAVTGSKQISMLGLAGVYSQINWENMPLVRGLSEYYGLGFVPGTWINSIHVGKGAGSVVNGYESMTGQINVEFHKPDKMDKLYLNGYQNVQGRSELNLHAGKQLNDQWSTGLFLHGDVLLGEPDGNSDGFIDRNKGGQINLMNRWKYVGKGNMRSQFGIKYLHDEKVGGQVGFNKGDVSAIGNLYGVQAESNRVEAFAKTGFIYPEKPWKSLGMILNGVSHNQDAIFGIRDLDSEQRSVYANLIYQTILGDTRHKLKTGANFQFDQFQEVLAPLSSPLQGGTRGAREYSVPGVFAEYDFDNLKNIKLVAGLRADYLNTTENVELSPRIHFKWNTDGENALRLSAGRGFRAPNLYADAPAMLVNSRAIVIEELPEIESSWNMGASLTRYFKLNGREGTFVTDFYRTSFEDQLIRDFYTLADHVYITNLEGKSYANSFQTSVDYELFDRFELRAAYKRDDVKQDINGKRVERQLTPKNRGLLNVAYATNYDRWKFDVTGQYTGEQRLPTTSANPNGLEQANYSDSFWKLNAQVTTKYRDWEFYVGGENLTNFKQGNPIIAPENPFGNDFDASSVWGPIMGTNVYAGFRFSIENEEK